MIFRPVEVNFNGLNDTAYEIIKQNVNKQTGAGDILGFYSGEKKMLRSSLVQKRKQEN